MQRRMKRVAASGAALVLMAAALAAGAAEKFVITLPNGYEMSRAKSGAASISKRRGKVVVPGPIKSYTVMREVVLGQLDVPEPKEAKSQDSNTATSSVAPAPDAAAAAAPAPASGAPPTAPPAAAPAAGPTSGGAPAGAAQGGGMPAPGAAGAGAGRPGAGGGAPPGGGRPAAAAETPPANPVFTRPPPSANGRYFVLDTKTGEVGKDLSLAEWEERLKKFDITSAPQLAEPILPK